MTTRTPHLTVANTALRALLPEPFAWIAIPGGTVCVEARDNADDQMLVTVAPFALAQYPLTNAQYAAFVDAGGYADSDAARGWWSDAGWKKKARYRWDAPHYWQDRAWNMPDCPVVGIAWYEAQACCNWLSAATGLPITLPTELQWQRAAQGDDGREFPWGADEPHDGLCNWNRAYDTTTPVTAYPAGASPYGVMDLSGNVWEWCLTPWELGDGDMDGSEQYVLRGGCWSSDSPISLRAAHRYARDPNTHQAPRSRDARYGFRLALGLA